jgi:hypothetical protein
LEHTKRSKEKDSNEIETIDPALIIESAIIIWVVFEREGQLASDVQKDRPHKVQKILYFATTSYIVGKY